MEIVVDTEKYVSFRYYKASPVEASLSLKELG